MTTTLDRRGKASRRGLRTRHGLLLAMFTVLGSVISTTVEWVPAHAAEYPTWEEVNAARNDANYAQALVKQIESAVAALQAESARTQADAEAKGLAYQEADQAFQEQAIETITLQEQADAAHALAERSGQQAGQLAAQLVRGGDPTMKLLMGNGDPDDLLSSLEISNRVGVQSYLVLEQALQDKNSAQALTDQADEARVILEELKVTAEAAFQEAQAAATAAQAAYETEQTHLAEMRAQLVVLQERRAATEADYLAGVRERWGAGAGSSLGEISGSGWTKPVAGRVTSVFGWRLHPIAGVMRLHAGTDLGAGCGTPIYAAAGGTVVYAGPNGGYGNFVLIDHGGVQTGYAHIMPGGIYVGVGQWVDVGTNIAAVGTTGSSTGCHLHLEVRTGGVAIDAQPFFEGQGIRLG